ncbi:MAG: hypothetical protein ACYC64_18795 [Armatimonadota bacterium]
MEKINYGVYGECCRLSNAIVEVLITLDVGPRVISYRLVNGENILGEHPDAAAKTEWGEWKPYGGHRLWAAPEALPRTYVPDNAPVSAEDVGDNSVRFTAPVEVQVGLQKQITVSLDPASSEVTVTNKLINTGVWPVEIAPWALTIMAGGGTCIIPQEPFISHDDYLLPARLVVLWHFTDMADPRYTFGKKYILFRNEPSLKTPQKIGLLDKQGWAGYLNGDTLFVKRFPYIYGATYPDCGCNFETYADGDFHEVETLGPLTTIEPQGSVEHVEKWYLFKGVNVDGTEESIDTMVRPLVEKITK